MRHLPSGLYLLALILWGICVPWKGKCRWFLGCAADAILSLVHASGSLCRHVRSLLHSSLCCPSCVQVHQCLSEDAAFWDDPGAWLQHRPAKFPEVQLRRGEQRVTAMHSNLYTSSSIKRPLGFNSWRNHAREWVRSWEGAARESAKNVQVRCAHGVQLTTTASGKPVVLDRLCRGWPLGRDTRLGSLDPSASLTRAKCKI